MLVMKINIYYGGRGIMDDPTTYVLDRMEEVLTELRVDVRRYNIYEQKNAVSTLVSTVPEADGVILATTVEWLGIGGHMAQFLDALWLYANKEEISGIYMMPVVMSTTYGERESLLTLENAWEILGGMPCSGLCGYVEDLASFEENKDYLHVIGKTTENMYRTISQKAKGLPNSNKAVTKTVLRTQQLALTPQESEQLSAYAADDRYVEQQKQDIIELSKIYKGLLGQVGNDPSTEFISSFVSHFNPVPEFSASYQFEIDGRDKPLLISVSGDDIKCEYRFDEDTDVLARLSADTMNEIVSGRMSFLRAFSMGDMTAKGQFSVLRKLDEIFGF